MLISKEYILDNSCVSPDHRTINYKNLSLILRLHNSPFIISPTHLHETQQKHVITGAGGISFEMFVFRFHLGTPFFLGGSLHLVVYTTSMSSGKQSA